VAGGGGEPVTDGVGLAGPVDACGELGGWGWLGGACVIGKTAPPGAGLTSTVGPSAGAAACDPLGGVGAGFADAAVVAGEPELP